jgi:hypothetical protein
MPRPRTPTEKVKATGRDVINPARYKNRKERKSRALGKPSTHLSDLEKAVWESFKLELPWLSERDRALVEVACQARACLMERGFKADIAAQLRICLSAMGATPADATKVSAGEDDADASDEFLQ